MRSFLIFLVAALLGGACGDNLQGTPADAMTVPLDAADGPDGSQALAPCLDRSTDLARPPVGQLPCDLLPPGFGQ